MFLLKKKLVQKITNKGKVLTFDQLKQTIAFSYTRLSTGNVDKPSHVVERKRKGLQKPVGARSQSVDESTATIRCLAETTFAR